MWWVLLYVAIGLASIVVLGLITWRLWQQVRQLGREVSAAADRLNGAMSELDRVSAK